MSKYLFFLIFIFSNYRNQGVWKAKIVDVTTGLPLENVHVYFKNGQAVTDKTGMFSLLVEDGQIVTISHVAYETMKSIIDLKNLPEIIYLIPKEEELETIDVRPLPSEAHLKRMILNTSGQLSQMEYNMRKNTAVIKSVYRYIPSAGKGAYSSFLERVIPNGSGGVNFFTSGGGGIPQLFKELRQNYELPTDFQYTERDSSKVDLLYKAKFKFNKW
ncbi:peptidase associated/transthyretin-like domain-containing protein [Aquiflexum lacus]|uniref:hypothetical protein n=1 Tax=Aquiflexum lacus TaxID=2483805 RepID=UPI001893C5C9|nr:hypothetical protein [Aquiflexum lacus]